MINFHFFGKECIIDKELNNRDELNQKLRELDFNPDAVLLLNQVHGNQIVVVEDAKKIYGNQNLPKADGIITNQKNIALGIITADCAPIIFYDEENNIIGACHAGWRGAKSGIIENTISGMQKLGAKDINAVIGPMIQQYSYQISQDFYDDFINENSSNNKFFRETKIPNKWQFDLPNYICERITKTGIEKIDNLEIDTYTNAGKYFSFRRSQHSAEDVSGRNISIICINPAKS